MTRKIGCLLFALGFLGACSKGSSSSSFSDRKADNAFTQMIDTGTHTMTQAQGTVDQMNAQTARQEKDMKDAGNQ